MNTRLRTIITAGALIAAASAMASQAQSAAAMASGPATNDNTAIVITAEPDAATDDQAITRAVEDKLRNDPGLEGNIQVITDGNEVTLNGTVTTPGEADRAERDARSIDGVQNVNNYLRMRVGEF